MQMRRPRCKHLPALSSAAILYCCCCCRSALDMCSVKDDRVSSLSGALRPINQAPTAAAADDPPIARLFVRNRAEYLMRKTRVTVGRSSAKSAADVDAGSSTYISRNHLEIYRTDSRFYVLVTGKNGLFVDGVFHRKGSAPFELQRLAILRFPSTDITIQFHVLVEDEATTSIKCPVPYVDDPMVKENVKTEVLCKPGSPVGKFPFSESQPLLAPVELKREGVAPVSAKPRHRESHVRESKATFAAIFEDGARDSSKPAYSYAQLIVQAISSQKDKQLTLSGIYTYITKKYPYYRSGDKGWQNSIRHNLSLNRYFIKVPRAQEESGKGSFWKIDPSSESMLIEQAFKKRRQRSTQGSVKTSQGRTTPSLASMSSVEVDGLGTPEDSCLSWEGGVGTDETNSLVIAEDMKPPTAAVFPGMQGNGAMFDSQGNQSFEDSQHQPLVPSFAHHALPQLIARPQFFIAKPSGAPVALNHLQGVVPIQLPATMVNTSSAVMMKSNDLLQNHSSGGDNKVFMLPDKLPSFMPRPPQIQGFHPKTVIVRMNSGGAVSGASAIRGSVVRLALGMPELESQNLLPALGIKADPEEMESEELATPIDGSSCVAYDATSDAMNGDMNRFKLQAISN